MPVIARFYGIKDWLPKHQSELTEMWRTQKIVELPPLD